MRRLRIGMCTALVATLTAAAAAEARGTARVTCAHQSIASFDAAAADRDFVVGPLRFVGLRSSLAAADTAGIQRAGGVKSQALLSPGHTVTVGIDQEARSFARLRYANVPGDTFAALPHTIRFVACSGQRAKSSLDGRPVTFWSGKLVLTQASACLPLTIRVDGGHARHRRLPIGDGTC